MRARSCATSTASRSWPTSTRSPISRHATSWRRRSVVASTNAASTTCGSTPPRSTSFPSRFPTIWEACRAVGLDPTRDWLPVAPAAHYLSGGVCTDLDGATTLPGCGRAAKRRARACTAPTAWRRTRCSRVSCSRARAVEAIVDGRDRCEPDGRAAPRVSGPEAPSPRRSVATEPGASIRDELQRIMTRDAGVLRSAASLERAADALAGMVPTDVEEREPAHREHGARARGDGAARVARHAHPLRLSRGVGRRSSAVSCSRAPPTPSSCRSPTSRARAVTMSDFDAPVHVVAGARRRRARRGPRPARRPHRGARPGRRLRHRRCRRPRRRRASPAPRARPRSSPSSTARWSVEWLVDDGDTVGPATKVGEVTGPLRVGAHRRAHRAQLPVPPVGSRHRDPPVRGGRRDRGAGLGHPQDAARAARGGEGRRARRRRRQPPRLVVGASCW